MKRSAALSPLSRDHHHALDAALRLRRATGDDVAAAVAHFERFFAEHGREHFATEERYLLPALPAGDPEWAAGVERVLADHEALRLGAEDLARAPADERVSMAHELGELLAAHVRFEERVLFPLLEQRLAPEDLELLGRAIDA